MREFCPRKQGALRALRPNLLILNKMAITSLSLFKPFSSNREVWDKCRNSEIASDCDCDAIMMVQSLRAESLRAQSHAPFHAVKVPIYPWVGQTRWGSYS